MRHTYQPNMARGLARNLAVRVATGALAVSLVGVMLPSTAHAALTTPGLDACVVVEPDPEPAPEASDVAGSTSPSPTPSPTSSASHSASPSASVSPSVDVTPELTTTPEALSASPEVSPEVSSEPSVSPDAESESLSVNLESRSGELPDADDAATESSSPSESTSPSASVSPTASASASASPSVEEVVVVGPIVCPPQPTGLTAAAQDSGALVSWDDVRAVVEGELAALGEDGIEDLPAASDVVTDIQVTVTAVGDALDEQVVTVVGDARQARVSGLRNGVEYAVRVIALGEFGAGPVSEPVRFSPTTGVEGEIGGVLLKREDAAKTAPASQSASNVDGVAVTDDGEALDGVDKVALSEAVDVAEGEAIARTIEAQPEVQWAEPDLVVLPASIPANSDSSATDARSGWNITGEFGVGQVTDPDAGAGVTVAVIDTGITAHPALDDRLVAGFDFVSNPEVLAAPRSEGGQLVPFDGDYTDEATYGTLGRDADPTDPGDWRGVAPIRDSTWHGTHTAEVIVDVVPAAKIQPIRALSWRGGLLSDVAAGLTWASGGTVDGVPANATPSKVINLSFSVQAACPNTLQTAIDDAVARGSVIVAAAGNNNDDASSYAPGNCANVITVGATNADGKRASYSNYGAVVDASAPGATLRTEREGTSIAAAHTAAALALIAAQPPGLTPDELSAELTGTYLRTFPGNTCDDAGDKTCGAGLLQIASTDITTCAATSKQAFEFAGGSGTSADPFQVNDTEALAAINSDEATRACAYKLTADITLSGEWEPIGTYDSDGDGTSGFRGILDGNGKSISGMSITSANHASAGLFGHIAGGQVKNLSIAGTINVNDADEFNTGNYQGILAGLIDGSTVTNVHVTGSNTGSSFLGGLVGAVSGSAEIINSSANVSVSTTYDHAWNVGGLVGYAGGPCVVRGSWATGAISGTSFTGGLVGGIWPSADVNSCRIEESYSTGNVTASKDSSGGLVGLVNSNAASVGGAVIRNSFASGNVDGRDDIGGLIGKINASGNAFNHVVADSYAIGTMSFSRSGPTGGLIGTIGTGTGPPVITNSFWDTQASGEDTSAGGTGLTTAAMKTVSTFAVADWAIDCPSGPSTWSIDPAVNDGYPYLTGNVGATGCNSTTPTPATPTPTGTSPGGGASGNTDNGVGSGARPAAGPRPSPPGANVEPVTFADARAVLPSQISALTPEQLASIPAAQFKQFSPEVFAVLTAAHVSALPNELIRVIRPKRAAALSPDAVAGMSSEQLSTLRLASMRAMSPDQIAAMSTAVIADVQPVFLAQLKPKVLAAMDATVIAALSPEQVAAIRPVALARLPLASLRQIQPESFAALSMRQLRKLTPRQVSKELRAELTRAQRRALRRS